MAKKKIEVDWAALCLAFDAHMSETTYFLDTETGQVLSVSQEDQMLAKSDQKLDMFAGKQRQSVKLSRRIYEGAGKRYQRIEPRSSYAAYDDMDDFIEMVDEPRARDLLSRAIRDRDAFRGFKETLVEFPAVQTRWNAYRDQIMDLYARDWIDSLDLNVDIVTSSSQPGD